MHGSLNVKFVVTQLYCFLYICRNVAHILLNSVWCLEHGNAWWYFDVLHDHTKFVRIVWLNHNYLVSIHPSDSYLIYYFVHRSEITARYCCNARNLQGFVLILCLGGHCNPWK
jgi:hypothetical protein